MDTHNPIIVKCKINFFLLFSFRLMQREHLTENLKRKKKTLLEETIKK